MGADHVNPTLSAVAKEIEYAARCDAKVLITGETSVGKELAARWIHERSSRAKQPLTVVDCAVVPEAALESELFGFVKGTFHAETGDVPGKIELAHRGTLFLDGVDGLTFRIQGLLLRVLETGQVQRLGADHTRAVDIRVIASTSANLRDMIAEGTFREDLYYRLAVIHLHVPALRERQEDVPLLAQYFLSLSLGEARPVKFSERALVAMSKYSWPGNIRELQHVVNQVGSAVLLSSALTIEEQDLPEVIRGPLRGGKTSSDFEVGFPEDCSPSDVKEILTALADYYRACGGLGFEVTFESEDVSSLEHAGA